jgi:hypothetical protein
MPISNALSLFDPANDQAPMSSSDTEVSNTGAGSYEKKKEIQTKVSGRFRIKFDLRTGNIAYTAYGQIYKNGAAIGTERTTTSVTYTTYSEDLTFNRDDLIQLYIKSSNIGMALTQNFRVFGNPYTQFIVNL